VRRLWLTVEVGESVFEMLVHETRRAYYLKWSDFVKMYIKLPDELAIDLKKLFLKYGETVDRWGKLYIQYDEEGFIGLLKDLKERGFNPEVVSEVFRA